MITRSAASVQTHWQEALSQVISDPVELLNLLDLDPALLEGAQQGSSAFKLWAPRPYVARIQRGDINDPLLKQVLPVSAELEHQPGYSMDPLGEKPKNQQAGVIHKYRDRLLFIISNTCAVNCRFCFRRHFPYDENRLNREQWQEALDYVRNDTEISEVIFSGGDPLALNDQRLGWIVDGLASIPHVQRLRIHTRFPIMIPQRITEEMLDWFARTRLQPIMVLHCNHANEINEDVIEAIQRLKQAGVTLLNQTVLLKGVNDTVDDLEKLSRTLFQNGVLPYYLHLLDKVQGAAHFDMEQEAAQRLVGKLAARCSGYLVPKLVREVAGVPAKTTLAPIMPDA
ncbi:EF-P beta-lysylation protein EpmB [Spongorhabdus nitratireducens]